MSKALSQFRTNIKSVQDLDELYTIIIQAIPTLQDNLQDLLRAEIVLSVSAFDCYIHDVIRFGMLKQFDNSAALPDAYKNFSITLEALHQILSTYDYNDKMISLDNEMEPITSFVSEFNILLLYIV